MNTSSLMFLSVVDVVLLIQIFLFVDFIQIMQKNSHNDFLDYPQPCWIIFDHLLSVELSVMSVVTVASEKLSCSVNYSDMTKSYPVETDLELHVDL